MKKTTTAQLTAMGFADTQARRGEDQIWQSVSEKIIYDARAEEILERFPREYKEHADLGNYSHMGVGARQYNDDHSKLKKKGG